MLSRLTIAGRFTALGSAQAMASVVTTKTGTTTRL
jgi:hypothetical protein